MAFKQDYEYVRVKDHNAFCQGQRRGMLFNSDMRTLG